jgi:hypothetical protein
MSDNQINSDFQGQAVNFYCNLKIKGHQIITQNIIHLTIKEWIFDIVPRIEITLSDDGTLTEVFPMQDGDLISVEVKKHQLDSPSTILNFDLIGYTVGAMSGNKYTQIIISGALHVNKFYSPIYTRSFSNKNSATVLKQLLQSEGGATLNTAAQTTDVMTWLQIHMSNIDFCKHILKRSYIANDTMFLYADTAGNAKSTGTSGNVTSRFNYTSFKTEADKNLEGTARYHLFNYGVDKFENDADYKDFWFNTYNVFDFHSYVNKIRNYGVTYTYYDTSSGKRALSLSDSTHPLSDLSAKDVNSVGQRTHEFDLGYLPVGNVYPKYYTAMVQNDYYKSNFLGGYILELNINSLGKPRLFSRVNVIIPSLLGPGSNESLSGNYIVAGLVHDMGRGMQYKKRMALIRNGFDWSEYVTIPTVAQ